MRPGLGGPTALTTPGNAAPAAGRTVRTGAGPTPALARPAADPARRALAAAGHHRIRVRRRPPAAGAQRAVRGPASGPAPGSELEDAASGGVESVSYTHLRAHETGRNLVCRL